MRSRHIFTEHSPRDLITLRPFRPDDAPALLTLYRDTIRRVNARDYSPEQIHAWASDEIDPMIWASRFTGRFVRVAVEADRPIGFAELEFNGHIDRFYVSADRQGRGIGRAMMAAVVEEACRLGLTRLFIESSLTARDFFERQGFTVLARQTVPCRGTELDNFRMERWLTHRTVGKIEIPEFLAD